MRIETSTPGKFDAELGDVAGRRRGREPRRVLLVHPCEVGRVRQKDADLDDVVERRPRGAKTASQFVSAWRVCSWIVAPASAPVAESIPAMPET